MIVNGAFGNPSKRVESGVVEKEVMTIVAGHMAGMGKVKCPVESLITAAPPTQLTRASGKGELRWSAVRERTAPCTGCCAKSAVPKKGKEIKRMNCFVFIQKCLRGEQTGTGRDTSRSLHREYRSK